MEDGVVLIDRDPNIIEKLTEWEVGRGLDQLRFCGNLRTGGCYLATAVTNSYAAQSIPTS